MKAGKRKNWAWTAPLSLSEVKPLTSEEVCGVELGSSGRMRLVSGGHYPFTKL